MKNRILISDVDGILTDGGHYYSQEGKIVKKFGSNDKDALKLLLKYFDQIIFITADKLGFNITQKRIKEDWGFECRLVPAEERKSFLKDQLLDVFFVGDGIFDAEATNSVKRFISVIDATPQAKSSAHIVLKTQGGKNVFSHLLYEIDNIL